MSCHVLNYNQQMIYPNTEGLFAVFGSMVVCFCQGSQTRIGPGGRTVKTKNWIEILFFKNRELDISVYVAISWTSKTEVGPHGSYRTGGKNHAVQPLSNFF